MHVQSGMQKKTSSRSQMFSKLGVLKIFATFTGKCRCFPVNIAKISRTPTLENICERLLLFFLHATLHIPCSHFKVPPQGDTFRSWVPLFRYPNIYNKILRCSVKKVFLTILQYSQEYIYVDCRPATLLKRDTNTGVFL